MKNAKNRVRIIAANVCVTSLFLQGCASISEKAFLKYHQTIGNEYKQYVIDRQPVPEWNNVELQSRLLNWEAANQYATTIEGQYNGR